MSQKCQPPLHTEYSIFCQIAESVNMAESRFQYYFFPFSFESHESQALWRNIKIQNMKRKHTESQARLKVISTVGEDKMRKLYIIYKYTLIDIFTFISQLKPSYLNYIQFGCVLSVPCLPQ